jgi:hypothetical protein
MPIIGGSVDSFKEELFRAIHDFGSDAFKIALYSDAADLGPTTTAYSSTHEVSGTGYTAGGASITIFAIGKSQGVSYVDISDVSWPGANFTARAALIYNTTKANRAVMVLDFAGTRTFDSSHNIITFPQPTAQTAVLRIGYPR